MRSGRLSMAPRFLLPSSWVGGYCPVGPSSPGGQRFPMDYSGGFQDAEDV